MPLGVLKGDVFGKLQVRIEVSQTQAPQDFRYFSGVMGFKELGFRFTAAATGFLGMHFLGV